MKQKVVCCTWITCPAGLSGGSQETTTELGPETTALIERGGPGTVKEDNHNMIMVKMKTMELIMILIIDRERRTG